MAVFLIIRNIYVDRALQNLLFDYLTKPELKAR